MPSRHASLIVGLLVAAALALPSAAHAADGFSRARGANLQAMVKIAKREGLRGRSAYLTSRAGGTTFGVACGSSGGEYSGMVPMKKVGGKWRTYDPVSGALQTYQAACEKRR